jgi:uncharacterized protein (UPF0264 family)
MQLLVGPVTLEEVKSILSIPGIDILDIKNTREGSYGAADPRVTARVVEFAAGTGVTVSATLGDLPCKPGTAALAALGAIQTGAQILKAGLFGARSVPDGVQMMTSIQNAIQFSGRDVIALAGGYADYESIGSLSLNDLLAVAVETDCAGVMLDTYYKDRGSIFDVLGVDRLADLADEARRHELRFVLAGSVQPDHLPLLARVAPDVVAIRGGLCEDGDRHRPIDADRVRSFASQLRDLRLASLEACS